MTGWGFLCHQFQNHTVYLFTALNFSPVKIFILSKIIFVRKTKFHRRPVFFIYIAKRHLVNVSPTGKKILQCDNTVIIPQILSEVIANIDTQPRVYSCSNISACTHFLTDYFLNIECFRLIIRELKSSLTVKLYMKKSKYISFAYKRYIYANLNYLRL